MQSLPKGITGFDALDEDVPIKQFTTACHTAVRKAKGRVHQVRAAYEQATTNFHEALVTLRDGAEAVRVLCNAHRPIVAFASPATHEGDMRIQFLDCPQLAAALSGDFSILSTQDACAGVSAELVAQLGEVELSQMRYWNPQRIGDVIFNYWD